MHVASPSLAGSPAAGTSASSARHRVRTARRVAAAVVVGAVVAMVMIPASDARADSGQFYSSKTPYPAPSAADIAAYSGVPDAYAVSYTESVARHGSRGLSSYKYDALMASMANTAAAEGGFVSEEIGQQFLSDVQAMTAANVENGYGMLTGQGGTQHEGIGARAYDRNRDLFSQVASSGDRIEVASSGEARATESGEHFVEGFLAESGGTLTEAIGPISADPDTLYFHKVKNPDGSKKQPGTEAYDRASAYEKYIKQQTGDDGTITAAIDFIESQPRSEEVSRDLLSGIFTQELIDSIGQPGRVWFNTADGTENGPVHCAPGADPAVDADACGEADKNISTPVDAAMNLYNLYIIAADMQEENAGAHTFDFDRYFAGHEADAEWFAYLLDAEDFYEKGPSLAGHDETYTVAQGLLDDFFAGIDARAAGGDVAATFRFAHAETIIPFSALLRLPGSDQQAPDVADLTSMADVYSYDANDWRGESVTPMAANIQWDVATRTGIDPATGAAYTPIVRMLLNEVEIDFTDSCTPIAEGSSWVKVTELKSCLSGIETTESPLIEAATPSTTPAQTTPAQTSPAQTTPAETVPAESSAAQSTPGAATPSQAGDLATTGADASAAIGAGLVALVLITAGGLIALARRRENAAR